jgi:hypothetical protein
MAFVASAACAVAEPARELEVVPDPVGDLGQLSPRYLQATQLGVGTGVVGDDPIADGPLEDAMQHDVVLHDAAGRQPAGDGVGHPGLHR